MRACKCGCREFYAHQLCRMDVIVDEDNCFLEDAGSDGHAAIYDAETPYGPYECRKCGAKYDSLDDLEESTSLKKWYFSFGSDIQFPFQNGWVVVEATDLDKASAIFRKHFPDRTGHEGILNCAFVYSAEAWEVINPERNWTGYKCYGVYSEAGKEE